MTFYEGFVNSPPTILSDDIDDTDTTIPVVELEVFPAGPNVATIGTGIDAETILYGAKSAASGAGNLLTVTREYDKTGTYGVKKAWSSGSVISRNFCKLDLDNIVGEIGDLHYENTVTISPTGGEYHTIQDALDDNATEYTLFLVYPGVYTDDTVYFTANNQSVIGLDNSTTQIIGQADTNVVDFGAFTGCVLNRCTIKVTAATTAISTVKGTTGGLIINDCTIEMTNGSVSGAQPACLTVSSTGTVDILFGFLNYTNTVAASGQIKAAIEMGTGSTIRLKRVEANITCSGASTGTTLAYTITTGYITAKRCSITVSDPTSVSVVGLYISGVSVLSEFESNNIRVSGGAANTATGIWASGSSLLRSFYNHIHVTDGGGTSYGLQIGATGTLTSAFDDIVAADGVLNSGGTYTDYPTGGATPTELGYVSGVTSAIQTQIDAITLGSVSKPLYDAVVYQDATTTYALDKDGAVLSSVLISTKTDDIPIQAAIDYLEALSADVTQGYALHISSGVYYIAAELIVTKPHHISGAGQQITIIRSFQDPAGLATFSIIPDTNIDDDGWQRGGFTLRDMTLDGSDDGSNSNWWGTYGVYFGGSINWVVYDAVMCHFENVTFRGFTKYGVYDNSNWGSMYLHCSFIRNGGAMSENSTDADIAMMNTGGLALFGNAHNVIGCNFYANSNGICVRGGNLSNFEGNVIEGNWLNGVFICNVAATYPYTVGVVTNTTHFICAGLHGIAHADDYIFVNGRSGSVITSFDDDTHAVVLTTPITGLTADDTFYFTPYRMDTPWDYGGPDMSTWNATWVESNGSYNDTYTGDTVPIYDVQLYTGSRHSIRNTNSANSTGVTNTLMSNGAYIVVENYTDYAGKGLVHTGTNPRERNVYSSGAPLRGYTRKGRTNVTLTTGVGAITHALGVAPTWAICTPTTDRTFVTVTSIDATNINIHVRTDAGAQGTTQYINWMCGV